jgi:hypothetical protein
MDGLVSVQPAPDMWRGETQDDWDWPSNWELVVGDLLWSPSQKELIGSLDENGTLDDPYEA